MDAFRHRVAPAAHPTSRWATFPAPWLIESPPRCLPRLPGFDLNAKVVTWLNVVATAWVVLGSEGIFAAIDAKAMERSGAELHLSGLLFQGLLTFCAVPLTMVTLAVAFRRRADARWPLILSGAALFAATAAFWWMLTSMNIPIDGPGPC